MIYVDTSVVLATLLGEGRVAPPSFWRQLLVSSRLLAFEVWVRVHAKNVAGSHAEQVGSLLGRIAFLEMESRVLQRALEPFPGPVRTLDAMHLATACFLQGQGQSIQVATFDERMAKAARQLRLDVLDIDAD